MKAFLELLNIALLVLVQLIALAFAIAFVLWAVGLFNVSGMDVLRLFGATIGTLLLSVFVFVVKDLMEGNRKK